MKIPKTITKSFWGMILIANIMGLLYTGNLIQSTSTWNPFFLLNLFFVFCSFYCFYEYGNDKE